MKIFIDTWGWLTLQDKREPRHQEVKGFYENFRRRNGRAYTTDYVLDETITLLFRRLPFSTTREFLKDMDQAVEEKYNNSSKREQKILLALLANRSML